jgi:hypothetical protein
LERKYKQHGYMSADKPQKKEKRPPEGHPRQEQIGPRTPRMVGTITRARCSNCGAVLQPGFDPKGKCPKSAGPTPSAEHVSRPRDARQAFEDLFKK